MVGQDGDAVVTSGCRRHIQRPCDCLWDSASCLGREQNRLLWDHGLVGQRDRELSGSLKKQKAWRLLKTGLPRVDVVLVNLNHCRQNHISHLALFPKVKTILAASLLLSSSQVTSAMVLTAGWRAMVTRVPRNGQVPSHLDLVLLTRIPTGDITTTQ
jgi:hypothetical protein